LLTHTGGNEGGHGQLRCDQPALLNWQLRDYNAEGQLGCEATPEEFVQKLVNIFAAVRRVLTPDGIVWLNIGDTYCGGGGYCPNAPSNLAGSLQSHNRGVKAMKRPVPPGYKPKDLAGVPWMAALALRKDGWYLRDDVIWEKTNGSPENVTDRPTRTHEYVFLLSKSKRYYYNAEAVKEPSVDGGLRNRRSVWRIPTTAYKGAHFATFPEKLVEVCLLSGSRPGDTVLDPFSGAATVGVVAMNHGRNYVGLEINEEYCNLSIERLTGLQELTCKPVI